MNGLSIYQHVAKFRYRIQGMSQNVQSITEWRCLIKGLQQNVTKYNRILLLYSPNVTEYSRRNNGVFRNELQTDTVAYISKLFDIVR